MLTGLLRGSVAIRWTHELIEIPESHIDLAIVCNLGLVAIVRQFFHASHCSGLDGLDHLVPHPFHSRDWLRTREEGLTTNLKPRLNRDEIDNYRQIDTNHFSSKIYRWEEGKFVDFDTTLRT